jgi:hypothetical protein
MGQSPFGIDKVPINQYGTVHPFFKYSNAVHVLLINERQSEVEWKNLGEKAGASHQLWRMQCILEICRERLGGILVWARL